MIDRRMGAVSKPAKAHTGVGSGESSLREMESLQNYGP